MAGHSKWANIKHRKAGQDAKRAKIFTKLIRELTVAARESGADHSSNPRLRTALDKALANNMKRDTIDKAVERGAGQLESVNYETIRYEGYGPQGIAILVDCLTDNRQRTVADVRHTFSKNYGNLGIDGSVAYLFEQRGIVTISYTGEEDLLLELLLDYGTEEIETVTEDAKEIYCQPSDLAQLKQACEQSVEHGIIIRQAEISHIATTKIELDLDNTKKNINLIDSLEDLDDVQQVLSNLTISDEIASQLE